MDLVEEQDFTQANYWKLVSRMPKKIEDREDKVFLKIVDAKTNPARKLASLYQMMGVVFDYVQGFTPCKKGCGGCCHIPVTISEVEIQHIERYTKHKRLKAALPTESFHGQPCVFLKQRSCSIYGAKPQDSFPNWSFKVNTVHSSYSKYCQEFLNSDLAELATQSRHSTFFAYSA